MNRMAVIAAATLLVSAVAAQACDPPPGFNHVVEITENDLHVVFATESATRAIGDVIPFFLSVKNVGTSTCSMNWDIDPQYGFFVTDGGCASGTQAGCLANAVYAMPGCVFHTSTGTTLEPSEYRVWMDEWDTAVDVPAAGTYSVLGGMFEPTFDSAVGTFHVPAGGLALSLTLQAPLPVEDSTWGKVKALYQ